MAELIEGVKVRELRVIGDERGFLMELLRSDWEEFDKFGQVLFCMILVLIHRLRD